MGCDMYGSAWDSNHTPRPPGELFFLNVLYLDGHVRGLLVPGHEQFVWADHIPGESRRQRQHQGRRDDGL